MIMQCIFAFCAIISFSVINEAPKKCLFINGVLGMAGWAVYLYIDRISTMLTATFVSGLVLAVASHILARILKTPVTTMLIPAILTIVPGAGTVYNLFLSDMDGALSSLVYTIGAAGAIAIAIFLVDAFVVAIKKIVKKRPQTD